MALGGLAHRALEDEYLVREPERLAVAEVDLHLARPALVVERVDVERLGLAVVVEVLEEGVELVDRVDAELLAPGLAPAGGADGRLERLVRIGVLLHQVELDLRRDDGVPAALGEALQQAREHAAGVEGRVPAAPQHAIGDHLRGGLVVPGHEGERGRVRLQHEVAVAHVDGDGARRREVAGERVDEDVLGQAVLAAGEPFDELVGGQDLAARHAREVGHDALDLDDAAFSEPGFDRPVTVIHVRSPRLIWVAVAAFSSARCGRRRAS